MCISGGSQQSYVQRCTTQVYQPSPTRNTRERHFALQCLYSNDLGGRITCKAPRCQHRSSDVAAHRLGRATARGRCTAGTCRRPLAARTPAHRPLQACGREAETLQLLIECGGNASRPGAKAGKLRLSRKLCCRNTSLCQFTAPYSHGIGHLYPFETSKQHTTNTAVMSRSSAQA